jgi:hypothetical protein
MSEDLVRLRGAFGQDEVNARGKSFRVNQWGCVSVPAEDIGPLLKTGGFHVASEDDESADHSTLEDVASVAWHLPKSKVRSTLMAILRSPNSMNHLTQSIAFT